MIFVLSCLQTDLIHSVHTTITTITNTVSFKKHSVFILWLKWNCRIHSKCSSNDLQLYNVYKPLSATAICLGVMSYLKPHWPCCCSHAKFIEKECLATSLCRDASFQNAQEVANPRVECHWYPYPLVCLLDYFCHPVGRYNVAIRSCTAEPQGPTPDPMARLFWWQPTSLYGSISFHPVHLVFQKKAWSPETNRREWVDLVCLALLLKQTPAVWVSCLVDGACAFIRFHTVVCGRPTETWVFRGLALWAC